MKSRRIGVVRGPGQQVQFLLDRRLRQRLPRWLLSRLDLLEASLGRQLFDRYLPIGNRHCKIPPIRESKLVRMLREEGYEPLLVDYLPDGKEANRHLISFRRSEDLEVRLTNFGKLPLSYHEEGVMALALERLARDLSGIDIVLISTTFAFENPTYALMIKALKALGKRVVVGGPDASVNPYLYASYGADLVFRGDFRPGEPAFQRLTAGEKIHRQDRITGYGFRPASEKIPHPRDVAEFVDPSTYSDGHGGPIPAWLRSEVGESPVWGTMFSYGCPMGCDFCDTPLWSGVLSRKEYAHMSLEHALHMIDAFVAQGVRILDVMDDNLLLMPRPYLEELFRHMAARDLYWSFPNGLQISLLLRNPGLVDLLFPETEKGNRGHYLYWPLEAVTADGGLDRSRYRKLATLQSNIELMRTLLRRRTRIKGAVILLREYTEHYFETVGRFFSAIEEGVGSAAQTRLRFSVYHAIPLGELRTRGLPPTARPSRALHRLAHSSRHLMDDVLAQGCKYLYLPNPIRDLNFNSSGGTADRWPATAQAYLYALLHEVDGRNAASLGGHSRQATA